VLTQDLAIKPDSGPAESGEMNNWEVYVKESYQLITEAEQALTVSLAHDVEAYVVHLFAHFLDKPNVNTEPLGIKLMASSQLPVTQRKEVLKAVGDECLLINAMEWNRRRWPSDNYYAEIGCTAYMSRAYVQKPIEDVFDNLAAEFATATKVLRKCRIS
jgi:hypothetical protein